MKYLLLGLLGVAQARERQLSGTEQITWDILDQDGNPTSETGSAPCPLSDDAVHSAMCGRALSDAPCDTSGFTVGSVHAMNSGSCGGKARLYRVAAGDSDSTRKIFRCGPDEAPICAKDGHTKTSVDPAADCNTAYADKDAQGNPLGHYNWDVGLLCSKNAGADLTAGGSSSSGPSCDYVVRFDLHDEFSHKFHFSEPVACENSECSEVKPLAHILAVSGFSEMIDYAIQDMQIAVSPFECCHNSMISLTENQIQYFMDNTFVAVDTQFLSGSILEQINHYMIASGRSSGCSSEPCDHNDIMRLLFHPQSSIFASSDTTAEIEACGASAGPSDGPSDGPSELPTCTSRYNQDDCDNTGDGRICVWDGSSCVKHPCDTIICSGDLVLKSPYPNAISLNLDNYVYFDQCCKPERKGCKDDPTSYTYDPNVDVHNSSLCFTQKSEADKVAEVVGKTTYLAKRAVHKGHAKRAFYKKRAEGSTKKAAIRAARETIQNDDLPQRVKDRKRTTVKVAVAVNDAMKDTCRAGVGDDNCVSLDLAEDRAANETTILLTEDEEGSWAVVADGQDLIIKQTRYIDGGEVKFTLQCWVPEHSDWASGLSKSSSTDASIVTHKCGSHVFMVGSLQQVCEDCTDGCDEAAGLCYVPGCTDDNVETPACNYNNLATIDDGTCTYAAVNYDCAGACTATVDCAGTCNGTAEDLGCGCGEEAAAVNYDCGGTCLNDADGDGVCDEVDPLIDSDNDGLGDSADTVSGCKTQGACNYDLSSTVNHDASLCDIPDDALCETCVDGESKVTFDADEDGVCDDVDTCIGGDCVEDKVVVEYDGQRYEACEGATVKVLKNGNHNIWEDSEAVIEPLSTGAVTTTLLGAQKGTTRTFYCSVHPEKTFQISCCDSSKDNPATYINNQCCQCSSS